LPFYIILNYKKKREMSTIFAIFLPKNHFQSHNLPSTKPEGAKQKVAKI
jgi:hypothetical protein